MVLPFVQRQVVRVRDSARERTTIFKMVSFGLIGVINTAVDIGVFLFGYYLLGLPIVVANMFSWVVAVTCSYILNSKITFSIDVRRGLSVRNYFAFAFAQAAGFLANTSTVVIASHFVPVLFGKLLASVVSFIVNFALSHFFVFGRPAADL